MDVLFNALRASNMSEESLYTLLVELLISYTESLDEEDADLEALLTVLYAHVWGNAK